MGTWPLNLSRRSMGTKLVWLGRWPGPGVGMSEGSQAAGAEAPPGSPTSLHRPSRLVTAACPQACAGVHKVPLTP